MTDAFLPGTGRRAQNGWMTRLAGSRRFQSWAASMPVFRWISRREGAEIFDLVAGFCHSQVLMALVELGLLDRLAVGPATVSELARHGAIAEARLTVLLRAGAALGLLRVGRKVRLTPRGAALIAVPGLTGMIRHHRTLYRDLEDPAAFFRGETETELAALWPYVFGAGAAEDPGRATIYSRLMSDSMALVAEDTLWAIDLRKTERLMDVGGGTGAFLTAVAGAYPELPLTLFDLPAVTAGAPKLPQTVSVAAGSFRDDPLPKGADTISLVRVLYDHNDATVQALLASVHAALPPGGRIIISEPMAECRAGDAYFALYCMAMRTGQARSSDEIAAHLRAAGFGSVGKPQSRRPFVTTVLEAVRSK